MDDSEAQSENVIAEAKPKREKIKPVEHDYFPLAVRYVIQNEIGSDPNNNGGFTNAVPDKGGATKWGITYRTLCEWRCMQIHISEVEQLTRAEAEEIYRKLYWEQMKCQYVRRAQVAITLLDTSVLYGVRGATRFAQHALRGSGFEIACDGIIGRKTLEAIHAVNVKRFIENLQTTLEDFVTNIVMRDPRQQVHFDGWVNRIDRLKTLV